MERWKTVRCRIFGGKEMRTLLIFLVLLVTLFIGWMLGATANIVRNMEKQVGILHIDEDYDYIWQFEFSSDASISNCKSQKFVTFRVDPHAHLYQNQQSQ